MLINIVVAGVCLDAGKQTQRSGCAALLSCTDKDNRKAKRSITTPLGPLSQPQSDIQAAMLGLGSIADRFRTTASVTLTCSNYVYKLLERDGGLYCVRPQKNTDLAQRLRMLYEGFGSIKVAAGTREDLDDAAKLARDAANAADATDTGTRVCDD